MFDASSLGAYILADSRRRTTRDIGVVAVDFDLRGGGLAHAARLVRRALAELTGFEPETLALNPRRYDGVSLAERIAFAARLGTAQAFGRIGWPLFMHLSLARAQVAIPRTFRPLYGVFLHDVEGWNENMGPRDRVALAASALRLANSNFTARRVMRAHPSVGDVAAVPLGLEDDSPTLGRPDRELLSRVAGSSVLIVGRMHELERYKGHDELLECWPQILAQVPEAQLVVAGLGNDVPRLRSRAESLGIADRILWTGFVDAATLSALYRSVAVFAMPSRREGFGLVYLEAMRAALPCVGSTEDAAGEIIVDGETGFLVPQHDLDALATRLVALLSDQSLCRRLGMAGRERYQQEFTFAHFRDRLGAALRAKGGPWNDGTSERELPWGRT